MARVTSTRGSARYAPCLHSGFTRASGEGGSPANESKPQMKDGRNALHREIIEPPTEGGEKDFREHLAPLAEAQAVQGRRVVGDHHARHRRRVLAAATSPEMPSQWICLCVCVVPMVHRPGWGRGTRPRLDVGWQSGGPLDLIACDEIGEKSGAKRSREKR